MANTTIVIRKETAEKIKQIAESQNRSVSAQIDFIITKHVNELQNSSKGR